MTNPLDQFDFTVDHSAEPVDIDEVVAEFLIQFTRSRSDASESDDHNNPRGDER